MFCHLRSVLIKNFGLMRSHHAQVAAFGLLSNVGILFFLMCCMIENYMEFPQAIFMPILLFVVAGSRAATIQQEESGAESDFAEQPQGLELSFHRH